MNDIEWRYWKNNIGDVLENFNVYFNLTSTLTITVTPTSGKDLYFSELGVTFAGYAGTVYNVMTLGIQNSVNGYYDYRVYSNSTLNTIVDILKNPSGKTFPINGSNYIAFAVGMTGAIPFHCQFSYIYTYFIFR